MLNFLFKKRECETAKDVELNRVYEELKKVSRVWTLRVEDENGMSITPIKFKIMI